MFGFIFGLVHLVLNIYKLLLLVHFVITLVKVPENKWTSLLSSITEPVLGPVRKLVNQYLPKNWQICDWSPIALIIVITLIQWLLP
ncbi:MAG: YggT family protein [Clostridia bacterium]|nr:YggT family protein [Clostridia bacterium]